MGRHSNCHFISVAIDFAMMTSVNFSLRSKTFFKSELQKESNL